jgi:hypothetical protein
VYGTSDYTNLYEVTTSEIFVWITYTAWRALISKCPENMGYAAKGHYEESRDGSRGLGKMMFLWLMVHARDVHIIHSSMVLHNN